MPGEYAMTDIFHTILNNRGLLKVSGKDKFDFLQGLVSNDVTNISRDCAIYAAMLTPQGKFLFDFFMYDWESSILIETEGNRLAELKKRLNMYKLRAEIDLEDVSASWCVNALWGADALAFFGLSRNPGAANAWQGGVIAVDPRISSAGARALLPNNHGIQLPGKCVPPSKYDLHRLDLGLPDGGRDMILEKSILLEYGFDELNGINWDKGCYIGQELTARTKYRGLIKKRLVPVNVDGVMPPVGTPILMDGKNIGELRSGRDGRALAVLRIEHLQNTNSSFTAENATVFPKKPNWAEF